MYRTDSAPARTFSEPAPALTRNCPQPAKWKRGIKRAVDLALTLCLLLVIAPLILLVAIGVAISSGWPVIFSHHRVGRDGRLFPVFKFRSMRSNSDVVLTAFLDSDPSARDEWNTYQKLRNDPRVTRFGRFLRATSLDELPQLWNVLRGDMSLVGPRPITEQELHRYGPHAALYCAMRPGITGMWQVNGRSTLTFSQRISFDVDYVTKWSNLLDLRILAKTLKVVFIDREGSI